MLTYSKTQDGVWVVRGPANELKVGQVVVSLKSGETKVETITRLGKPFNVDGVPHMYGYPAPKTNYSKGSTKKTYTRCRECRGPLVDAPHCAAQGGYCGRCAFDEF